MFFVYLNSKKSKYLIQELPFVTPVQVRNTKKCENLSDVLRILREGNVSHEVVRYTDATGARRPFTTIVAEQEVAASQPEEYSYKPPKRPYASITSEADLTEEEDDDEDEGISFKKPRLASILKIDTDDEADEEMVEEEEAKDVIASSQPQSRLAAMRRRLNPLSKLYEFPLSSEKYFRVSTRPISGLEYRFADYDPDTNPKGAIPIVLRQPNYEALEKLTDVIQPYVDRHLKADPEDAKFKVKWSLGARIFATTETKFKCVQIRQYNAGDPGTLFPSKVGVSLKLYEWHAFVEAMKELKLLPTA